MARAANGNGNGFTCLFKLEKETKGAVRYMQVDKEGNSRTIDNGAELGSVYIRKSAFKNGAPTNIRMVISEEK